ncbi:MAG: hypothetical protein DMD96_09905 [Candidatus Rokuibacteriota bacterium]|nr:MAG: hypothetical protein DMD96_09905 [Candidatus Rokubacteria bacterium]
MSSSLSALLSATFAEPGYEHLVELIHQRDAAARRRLEALDVELYDARGGLLATRAVDPRQEVLDLGALVAEVLPSGGRALVLFDARYDERVFPYRPHHYAYLHRPASGDPPLYYAVNATLGGVPDRIGAPRLNNFETYLFRARRFAERYSLLLGSVARFAEVEARVSCYYAATSTTATVTLGPKRHAEIELALEHAGEPLTRVEVKALFRLATYVVGRRASSGSLVLFDHLFTYFK